jgi:single-stranded DNA-binding protein
MILRFRDGRVLASGRVTKFGSTVRAVGPSGKARYTVSLQVAGARLPDGTYQNEYLDVVAWQKDAVRMPALEAGDVVFLTGTMRSGVYADARGEEKTAEVCVVGSTDGIFPAPPGREKTVSDGLDAAFSGLTDGSEAPP